LKETQARLEQRQEDKKIRNKLNTRLNMGDDAFNALQFNQK